MQQCIVALARLNAILCRVSLWLAGMGLVVMTIIVFAQVFMRYVMNDSLHWVEPVALLLMSCFIFMGAAVGVYEKFHLGFEVLLFFLPARFGNWLKLVSDLAVLIIAVCMVIDGWELMARTWGTSMPVIGLPGGVSYLPLFLGGVLMTLFILEHALSRAFGPGEAAHDGPEELGISEI